MLKDEIIRRSENSLNGREWTEEDHKLLVTILNTTLQTEYMSTRSLSVFLDCHRTAAYQIIKELKIPTYKLSDSRIRVKKEELLRAIEERRIDPVDTENKAREILNKIKKLEKEQKTK